MYINLKILVDFGSFYGRFTAQWGVNQTTLKNPLIAWFPAHKVPFPTPPTPPKFCFLAPFWECGLWGLGIFRCFPHKRP